MISSEQRKCMIEPCCPFLSISTQCQLLTLTRSSFYYIPSGESEENLAIMRQLDEQYFSTPFLWCVTTYCLADIGWVQGKQETSSPFDETNELANNLQRTTYDNHQ